MASLTPLSRSDEVTGQAMNEGYVHGAMVFAPSLGALYLAMKNPTFRKVTNVQSRTALVIMPALFAFAFTAENKLINRMEEVAEETEHAIQSVHWAERQKNASAQDIKLHELYRQSVLNSNVRLVDGDLQPQHKVANYVQANPFKVIAGIGVPAVASIFYGQRHSSNVQLQILHTRVFGQFSVICTLLGVMTLKEVMDRQGRYITEDEVEARVAEMENTRRNLFSRLEYQQQEMEQQKKHMKEIEEHMKHGSNAVAHA